MKKLLLILLCLPFIGFGQHDVFDKIRVVKGKEKVEDIFEGVGRSTNKNSARSMSRVDGIAKILEKIEDTSLVFNNFKGVVPLEELHLSHVFLKGLSRKEKRKYKRLIKNNLIIDKDGFYIFKRYYIVSPLEAY